MAMEEEGLPPGYCFYLLERESVEYLLKKVTGQRLPFKNPVKDIDVYGDPKIWTELFQITGTLYFYTKLTRKKENGETVARATEFGTWRGQSDDKVFDYGDEEARDGFNQKEKRHIGSKRTFTFVADGWFDPKGRWTMHEYRLDGVYRNITNNDDYVLCEINKCKSKIPDLEPIYSFRASKNSFLPMAMEEEGLPLGYRFCPLQRELVEYLLKKVTGQRLPSKNPVKDIDVYGDPETWTELFQITGTLYFYTKLTRKKEKGVRVARATKFGTWRGQSDDKVFDYGDEEARDGFNQKEKRHIGSKRTFTFVAGEWFGPKGRWTMHEYRLDGVYRNITNNDDYVLCEINKCKSKIPDLEPIYSFRASKNSFLPMAMEEEGLPLGYRFCPLQRELVEYLLKKVTGQRLPSKNPVKDIDVYGDPKTWTELFQITGTLYFYTKLTRKKEKGVRVARATKFGTWRGQSDDKVFDYGDEEARDGFNQKEKRHIGSKRTFTFVAEGWFDPKGRWTMHEYRLDGVYRNITNNDDYVLCQINKRKSKKEFARDNSHQVENIATSENQEHLSLISKNMSTLQIGATIKTQPLDFSDIDRTEVISMDNASHDVPPLNMVQDEEFVACYNALTPFETPCLGFSDIDRTEVISKNSASHNVSPLNMEQHNVSEFWTDSFFA